MNINQLKYFIAVAEYQSFTKAANQYYISQTAITQQIQALEEAMDVRLIDPHSAALLAKLKWIRCVRLSCDTSTMVPVVEQAAAYLKEAGVAPSRL